MIYKSAITDNYALRAVALESNFISNGVKSIVSFFPSLLKSVSKGFAKAEDVKQFVPAQADNNLERLNKTEQAIADALIWMPYDDIAMLRLPVPEGFTGNYCKYFAQLLEMFSYHEQTALPAIEEYYISIAAIITNKDAKLSLKDNTIKYKALSKSREENNKEIAKHFNASSVAEYAYGKLFLNNQEVTQAFKLMHQLERTLISTKVASVTDQVVKITNALQTLISMAENGTIENLSPAQLKNLSEGAYEIAAQVEFFAINYYRAQVAINSLKDATQKLTKRLDD